MKGVTLQELSDWVEKNKERTWHFEGFKDHKKERTLEIKYLSFSLDTRDMMVWTVEVEGMGGSVYSVRDDSKDDERTILDDLTSKLRPLL